MEHNCPASQSAEAIVSNMSLSLVKAELKREDYRSTKGKKPSLLACLIVVLKQESKPSCSQNKSAGRAGLSLTCILMARKIIGFIDC